AVEELVEGLLPLGGVELVVLVHRNPGKLAPLLRDLPAELGVLGLDPCQLVASGLPLLLSSDFVLGHRVHLLWGLLIVGPVRRAKLIVRPGRSPARTPSARARRRTPRALEVSQ